MFCHFIDATLAKAGLTFWPMAVGLLLIDAMFVFWCAVRNAWVRIDGENT